MAMMHTRTMLDKFLDFAVEVQEMRRTIRDQSDRIEEGDIKIFRLQKKLKRERARGKKPCLKKRKK